MKSALTSRPVYPKADYADDLEAYQQADHEERVRRFMDYAGAAAFAACSIAMVVLWFLMEWAK